MIGRSAWKTTLLVAATVALIAAGVALGTNSRAMKLSAKMTAAQVVPKTPKGNVTHATGTLAGTLTSSESRWKISWRITYSRLDHPSVVIADIHYGKPRKFGPVIVRLCGPCKTGQHGVAKVKAFWVPAIKRGDSFITLITGQNPNGEIRGQIKVG